MLEFDRIELLNNFLYQMSSELRFTIFPSLWKNTVIFPIFTGTGISPQKVKKITGAFVSKGYF